METPVPDLLKKLHALAAGSPGRALEFTAGGLLPLAEKLDKLLAGLPRMDYTLVHSLIQSASGARNAQNFARLCDLTEERIEKFARQGLKNASGTKSSAGWAGLWETVRQRRLETETLNLDKGAFLMSVFSDIEHVARTL